MGTKFSSGFSGSSSRVILKGWMCALSLSFTEFPVDSPYGVLHSEKSNREVEGAQGTGAARRHVALAPFGKQHHFPPAKRAATRGPGRARNQQQPWALAAQCSVLSASTKSVRTSPLRPQPPSTIYQSLLLTSHRLGTVVQRLELVVQRSVGPSLTPTVVGLSSRALRIPIDRPPLVPHEQIPNRRCRSPSCNLVLQRPAILPLEALTSQQHDSRHSCDSLPAPLLTTLRSPFRSLSPARELNPTRWPSPQPRP